MAAVFPICWFWMAPFRNGLMFSSTSPSASKAALVVSRSWILRDTGRLGRSNLTTCSVASASVIVPLKSAFSLTERLLAVSTMVTGRETQAHSRPYRDGFLTKTNTFQKFFAPGELEALIDL